MNIKDHVKRKHSERATITHKGYGLDRETVSTELYKKIKEELTVKPTVIPDYDFGTQSFPVFRHNKTRIYLPKFFGIEKFGNVPEENKKERYGKDIKLEFKGSLRPDQEKYMKKILKQINTKDGCVAAANTGSGKTVCGLWLISQLKKKTLIIVHKEFLLNQWVERIKQFVPKARIGVVQGKKIEIKNKDIVIGMLQSLSKKDYPKGTFDSIGVVMVDEVHHVVAQSFSQVLHKINSHKILGLSATPKRKDGLTKVLKWFFGPIIEKEVMLSRIETPSVKIVHAVYDEAPKPTYNFKNRVNLPNLINQIAADPGRNRLIVEQIIEQTQTGRKILLLSDRRKMCTDLKDLLEESVKKLKLKKTVGLYLGSMKDKDLTESNKCDIILATFSMASEGYDNSTLDTLILSTSKSDIVQSVGRVLRKKNKFPPLIIDIADPDFCFGQMNKRRQFYKKKGFKIIGETKEKKKKRFR